eukprot:10371387-Alexandrium_andersonii.AAC.1
MPRCASRAHLAPAASRSVALAHHRAHSLAHGSEQLRARQTLWPKSAQGPNPILRRLQSQRAQRNNRPSPRRATGGSGIHSKLKSGRASGAQICATGISDFRRPQAAERAVWPIARAGTAASSGWGSGPELTLTRGPNERGFIPTHGRPESS